MGIITCFTVWLSALAPAQLNAREEANRLAELWGKQRKEIRNASITAEHLVYYPNRIRKAALEVFLADLEKQVENGIDQVKGPMLSKSPPPDVNRRHDWQRLSLVQDGPRCRAESRWQTPTGQARLTMLAFDGEHEVHWRDATRQANLYRGRTAMAIPDVSAFRLIPCLPPAGLDLWINEYKLACYVRTTQTGFTCERIVEYVPCYINRPGVNVCVPPEVK